MEHDKMHSAIRRIGLAMNASHHVISTDDQDIEPNKKFWRTNLADLEYVKQALTSIDIYPECSYCNKSL